MSHSEIAKNENLNEKMQQAAQIIPVLRMLHGGAALSSARFLPLTEAIRLSAAPTVLETTPEDFVFDMKACVNQPDVVIVAGVGCFVLGDSCADVEAKINGDFHSDAKKSDARLGEKIAIVTGSAQGFGRGIAEAIVKEGAYVVIADMNFDGATALSAELNQQYGRTVSVAVQANVTDEASVEELIQQTACTFGGLDIFINNAGIVRAGSLDEMEKSAFELVTAVNYTAYFLCVKYASKLMKLQHSVCPDYMMDIIEINSKSGLVGSNKNFAYAGSKFGGIGLTQSFALELIEFNIKVNAVCPGNFLNGPLWSDPDRGLFVQYLHAGKVPGAKTVEDVRRAYEMKTPIHRGCEIVDVARAVCYIVEQKYETGQALPVTGGQQMLK